MVAMHLFLHGLSQSCHSMDSFVMPGILFMLSGLITICKMFGQRSSLTREER